MRILKSIRLRRSIYALGGNLHGSINKKIVDIIKQSLLYCPTAFNSQSSRIVLLLGENHDQLWDMTKEVLKTRISNEEQINAMQLKIDSFKQAYGTILYFEDISVIKKFENDYPLYKDNFMAWANQANGMLQMVIWTALAEENIGASLQHYNPVIDDRVKAKWHISDDWKLIAQMPFGVIRKKADKKDKIDVDARLLIFE